MFFVLNPAFPKTRLLLEGSPPNLLDRGGFWRKRSNARGKTFMDFTKGTSKYLLVFSVVYYLSKSPSDVLMETGSEGNPPIANGFWEKPGLKQNIWRQRYLRPVTTGKQK